MKTLKAMVMGLALLLVCGVSQAASVTGHNATTKDEAVDTYINAVVHGKIDGINDVIDDDAKFNMTRGDNVNTLSKPQVMNGLKLNENIEQECQCTKTVMQDNDDMSVIKIDMKYNDFTRTDVITAQRSGKEWKITKVDTSFK
jgi:hypothetical protein